MDAQSINIFIEALVNVFESIGVKDIKKANILKKEVMKVEMDITTLIGLAGDLKGNVAYSFDEGTGKKIIEAMTGKSVDRIDGEGRSAIVKMADAVTELAGVKFTAMGKSFSITPPSLIFGRDVIFVISSVDTLAVNIDTSIGKIQLNIGLEG